MEPNWTPLESALGKQYCVGFMFMGRLNGVNAYKHGILRTYLYLDDEGTCYEGLGNGGFRPAVLAEKVRQLEQELQKLGFTLATPYNDEFIAMKARVLEKHGIEVVRLECDPDDVFIH